MRILLALLFCGHSIWGFGQAFYSLPTDAAERSLYVAFQKGDLMAAITDADWRPGLCLAMAQLSVGSSASLQLSLAGNTTYTFLAACGNVESDTDMYIHSPGNELIALDEETDDTPVVTFTTDQPGNYTLTINLAAGPAPVHYVAVGLLQQSGSPLLRADFQAVSAPFFEATSVITTSAAPAPRLLGPGNWCTYGFLMQGEEGAGLTGLQTGKKHLLFAGSSGQPSAQHNLYLATEQKIVANSGRRRNSPVLRYHNETGSLLDLRITAKRLSAPTLFLLGVFQK